MCKLEGENDGDESAHHAVNDLFQMRGKTVIFQAQTSQRERWKYNEVKHSMWFEKKCYVRLFEISASESLIGLHRSPRVS